MKWDSTTTQKSKKQPSRNTDEPLHRFYQPRVQKPRTPYPQGVAQSSTMPLSQPGDGRLQQLFQEHWRAISHRQSMKRGHLLSQNLQGQRSKQEDRLGRTSATNVKIRPATRLAWLQQTHLHAPKSLGLRTRFADVGMQVNTHQWAADEIVLPECELILLECFGMLEQEMARALVTIRMNSQIPLIVLTDNHTLDWSLGALRGGADAIFTVTMPDEVIVARSKALLRRWITE
jgi:hypothetical protein